MEALKKQIPTLMDEIGNHLTFDTYEFKLIESDIHDKTRHKVSIYYYSGVYSFFGMVGEYMLLATGDKVSFANSEPVETFLLKVPSNFSITSYQEIIYSLQQS